MDNIIEIIIKAKDEASAVLKQTEEKVSGLSDKFGGALKVGAIGAGIAIAGTTAILAKAAYEAGQEEIGITRLSTALKNQGISYDQIKAKLEGVIASTQKKTGIADDAQRESIAALVTMTGDLDKALELNQLAMDLSVAKQMDLTSAAEVVGKVYSGNTDMLSRYGIVIEKDATSTQALAKMTQMFGGQAEAMGKTTAGAMKILSGEFNNMLEDVGTALLPLLQVLMGTISELLKRVDLKKIIEQVSELAEKLLPLAVDLITMAFNLLSPFIDYVLPVVVDVLGAIATALDFVLGWVTKVVTSGIEKLTGFKDFFIDMWNKCKDAAVTVWHIMESVAKSVFRGILTVVLAPFKGFLELVDAIATRVNNIPLIGDMIPGLDKLIALVEVALAKIDAVTYFQHGGLIPEPTLLYGTKSQRFYGVAGETGAEYITPSAGITIPIYLDGQEIARYVVDMVSRQARQQGAY